MNLYDLNINLKNLEEVLDNCCDVPRELIEESMAQIEGEINTKIENIIKWIKNLEADTKALDEEIKRLKIKKAVTENKIGSLKGYLQSFTSSRDNKAYSAGIFNLSIRTNPGAVNIVEYAAIPKAYIRTEVVETVDKGLIKEAIKQGEEVPGIEITQSESLTIK